MPSKQQRQRWRKDCEGEQDHGSAGFVIGSDFNRDLNRIPTKNDGQHEQDCFEEKRAKLLAEWAAQPDRIAPSPTAVGRKWGLKDRKFVMPPLFIFRVLSIFY